MISYEGENFLRVFFKFVYLCSWIIRRFSFRDESVNEFAYRKKESREKLGESRKVGFELIKIRKKGGGGMEGDRGTVHFHSPPN